MQLLDICFWKDDANALPRGDIFQCNQINAFSYQNMATTDFFPLLKEQVEIL